MDQLQEYIAKLAAPEPLPGGGSAAALAGALAAAIGEMMSGLTEGREKYASVQAQVKELHPTLSSLRQELQALIQEDPAAYQSLLAASRLPRDTEAQIAVRREAVEKAARGAIDTPLRTARAACKVLEILKILIEIGNPNAKSDAAVGAQLAHATLKAGQYNVLANVRILKDRSFGETCRAEVSDLALKGRKIIQLIDEQIAGY